MMHALQSLQLFDQSILDTPVTTWLDLIKQKVKEPSTINVKGALTKYLTRNMVRDVDAAVEAIEWLGMLSKTPVNDSVPIDALCHLLQEKLRFKEGEKDMVAMFHTVMGKLPDGTYERHTSRLLAFGTPGGDSAVAATVGYATAVAAELILQGQIKETGVIIPTMKEIYQPMLKRLQELGITYTESTENFTM